jgi:2-methylcitrate dehydratase PrpD
MGETLELVDFVINTDYEDLPENVVEQAKICVLDYLGAALYGSTKEWTKYIGDFVKSTGCKEESTIIANNWKTSPQYAALMNGSMGHGFELDDFHGKSFLHPGTVVIPAALAIGEKERVNGRKFLTAVVLGYDVMIMVGLAVGVSHNLRGFHPTGTNGTFGAAAAAGKLLKFNEEQMLNAFGLAGSMSSGIMEFYFLGGMVKRLHAGKAAADGLVSALLAARGFTGPPTVLEGKFGYCKAFSDDSDLLKLNESLKKEWEIMNINIKPYACCGCLHPMINGLIELRRNSHILQEDIEKVLIETCEMVALHNSGPGTESVMAAQYSIPFSAALTLLRDIEDPAIYNEFTLKDKDILSLSKRVEVLGNLKNAGIEESRVTIKLKGGKKYTIEINKPKGHPGNPLSYNEVVRKFKKLSNFLITAKKTDKIIENVVYLEKISNINLLCNLVQI